MLLSPRTTPQVSSGTASTYSYRPGPTRTRVFDPVRAGPSLLDPDRETAPPPVCCAPPRAPPGLVWKVPNAWFQTSPSLSIFQMSGAGQGVNGLRGSDVVVGSSDSGLPEVSNTAGLLQDAIIRCLCFICLRQASQAEKGSSHTLQRGRWMEATCRCRAVDGQPASPPFRSPGAILCPSCQAPSSAGCVPCALELRLYRFQYARDGIRPLPARLAVT